jgi:hypothetical protein
MGCRLYRTPAQLLADLTASLAGKTLPARLRGYVNPDFDKWGDYLSDGPLAMAFPDRFV